MDGGRGLQSTVRNPQESCRVATRESPAIGVGRNAPGRDRLRPIGKKQPENAPCSRHAISRGIYARILLAESFTAESLNPNPRNDFAVNDSAILFLPDGSPRAYGMVHCGNSRCQCSNIERVTSAPPRFVFHPSFSHPPDSWCRSSSDTCMNCSQQFMSHS